MRFSASRISPVAPYFFLMATISSSLRVLKRSSNLVSKPCLSLIAVSAVRPSYRICKVALSRTASINLYVSMYSPKRFTVRLLPCCSVISGVPVKAIRVALGKASKIFSPRSEPCVRWASSIIKRMRGEGLTTPKVLPDGSGRYSTRASAAMAKACATTVGSSSVRSANLCTITMFTSEVPVPRCSRNAAVLSMTLTLPPISFAVRASCFSRSTRSLTSRILKSSRSRAARIMRATKTMVSDLPEPWVCQTTPERSSGVLPVRSRSTILCAARYCW